MVHNTEPGNLLGRSIVWFAGGIIVTAVVGTVAVQNYLTGMIDERLQNRQYNTAFQYVDERVVSEPRIEAIIEERTSLYTTTDDMTAYIDDNMPQIDPADTIPAGAVLAFDLAEGCPTGWSDLEDARGRMIIGTNPTRTHGYAAREFRDVGGKETVRLSIDEMPRHDHATGKRTHHQVGETTQAPPRRVVSGHGFDRGRWGNGRILATTETGGRAAHENMPPFIVLHVCKKD